VLGRQRAAHDPTDALHRALKVSEQIGCYAVLVRALHTKAAEFYAKFGFVPFVSDPLQLYLPIATIRDAADSGN